jgi:hypothetical protein
MSLRSWFPPLALVLLLVSTTTPALVRMTCTSSGHTTLTLGTAHVNCCEHETSDGPSLEPVCCVFDQADPNRLEFDGVQLAQLIPPVAIDRSFGLWTAPSRRSVTEPRIAPHPPPLSAHERLSRSPVFLI